ncbi:MAG TPA: hypothetical protein VMG98_05680 [Verrucomicrobiae bacterium]|nr:hypothetical protein [Verrucomicrobiae bacterium]
MKMAFSPCLGLLALAWSIAVPASAQVVKITVEPKNLSLKVGETRTVLASSEGSWPGFDGSTCNNHGNPRGVVIASIKFGHHIKSSTGGAQSIEVTGQHPGTCIVYFAVSAEDRGGNTHEATTQTDITVRPRGFT